MTSMNDSDNENEADAVSSPAPDCCESWWGLSEGNKALVAFQLGRLSNQTRWQMQQAWLLFTEERHRLVRRVLEQMIVEARHLPLDAAETIESSVVDVGQRWESSTGSLAATEELQGLSRKLRWDDRYSRVELCRETVSAWIDPLIADIRNVCKIVFKDEEWTYVAGETLDQGLRPEEAYKYMYRTGANELSDISQIKEYGFGDGAVEGEEPYRLANYATRPGEVPPAEGWFDQLAVTCQRAGIPDATLDPLACLSSQVSSATMMGAVAATDVNIRRHLARPKKGVTASWCYGPDDEPPVEYKFGPLEGQKQDLAKVILPGKKDARGLDSAVAYGRLWIRKVGRNSFEVWFKDQRRFETAKQSLDIVRKSGDSD